MGRRRLLACVVAWVGSFPGSESLTEATRAVLEAEMARGDFERASRTAAVLLEDASRDLRRPSVEHYLGVARYSLGDVEGAVRAFAAAVRRDGGESGSWLNLGDALLAQHRAAEARAAFAAANATSITGRVARDAVAKLAKCDLLTADWAAVDGLLADLRGSDPVPAAAHGIHLLAAELDAATLKSLAAQQPNSRPLPPSIARLVPDRCAKQQGGALRVGFLSADLGVHPVSALLRGALVRLHQGMIIEPWLFSLKFKTSWWRQNLTATLGPERVVELSMRDERDAALEIARRGVCLVVDLHGHTLGSGLRVLRHLGGIPVLSFLGSPQTTGAPFVGVNVADAVAVPPERSRDFSEKLLLLPPSYMPTDHAALQAEARRLGRAPRSEMHASAPFVFASFSNFGKLDPGLWTAWGNVLRRCPGSVLVLLEYPLHEAAVVRLRAELAARGVAPGRLTLAPLRPWVHHTRAKSAADVALDTWAKSMHATGLDALWAGVPVISRPGDRMETRGAASALAAAHLDEALVTSSAADYEALAVRLFHAPRLLAALRATVRRRTTRTSRLFDTDRWTETFARALRAAAEQHASSALLHASAASSESSSSSSSSSKPRHIVVPEPNAPSF